MLKRIFSIILVLLFLPILSVSADTLFFEVYTDSWNGYGVGRYGQSNVLRMQIEMPWEYVGVNTTPSQYGGDGVLSQNWEEFQKTGKTVYWVQSAVFPTDDKYVRCADSSLDDPYILPKGATSSGVRTTDSSAPEKFEGTARYETRVRFDDYNSTRYIFSPCFVDEANKQKYNDFMWFDKNGKAYVMCLDDGVAMAKEICSWTAGEWYDIALTVNFDYESVSVSVNGGNQVQNVLVQNMRDWTYLTVFNLKHENHTVTEREFSNSYFSGMKGYYLSESAPAPEGDSYYHTIDFTWNTGSVGRTGQKKALQLSSRQPWTYGDTTTAKVSGNEGMYPFEDHFRGNKMVYLLRSGVWPEGDSEAVLLGDNSTGIPKPCTIFNYVNAATGLIESEEVRESDTLQWEMQVRFDDNNSTRNLFSMANVKNESGDLKWTDFITVNRDGTITATFKNGGTLAKVTGGSWEEGKWHKVKLIINLKANTYSLYFDETPIVTNVLSSCEIKSVSRIKLMEQAHLTTAASISEREFSNAYIDFVKAKYLEDTPLIWAEKSDVTYSDGKYTADISVTNLEADKNFNVNCFMALYKEGALVAVKAKKLTFNGVGTKTADISIPFAESGIESKLFVLLPGKVSSMADGEGESTYVPNYYYILDFTDNASGYSRSAYNSAMHCNPRQPWTYSGNTTASGIGTEGMLPFDRTYTLGSSKVYWIKSGIWPTGDTEALFGASNKPIVPGRCSPYISVGSYGSANPLLEEGRESDSVIWEMRLRGDDFNSDRSIFVMGYGSGYSYKKFITFSKNGTLEVTYKNSEGENAVNTSATWQKGKWYDVKLRIDFAENTFSLYLDGNIVLKDAEAICDLDGWSRMKIIEHSHLTNSADITAREFSNTYVDFLKAQYVK